MSYNPSYLSGGAATFVVNGTDINVKSWKGQEESTDVDVTTTGDWDSVSGLTRGRDKATKTRFTATADAFIDANNYQFGTLRAGIEVPNLVLTTITGKTVTMALALIKTLSIDPGGTGGVQSFTLSVASQGSYTISS